MHIVSQEQVVVLQQHLNYDIPQTCHHFNSPFRGFVIAVLV
jgi:IS30 family transposase